MPDNYKENQDKFRARIGDRVKILCKARDMEAGWGTGWSPNMNRTIGQTGTVVAMHDIVGIGVRPDDETSDCAYGRGYWWYPYFVLSIVR